jgi:transmembrane sensor
LGDSISGRFIAEKTMEQIPINQIIQSFENRLSAKEQEELEKWLSESEKNRRQFEELRKTYSVSKKLKFDFATDEIKALKKVHKKINSRKNVRIIWQSVAAIIVLALTTQVLLTTFSSAKWIEITAQQRQTILLPDSSKVILAENSNLKYPKTFDENERNVQLNGTAYFEIKTNSKSSFSVNTSNTKTTVLGTKFLIDASNPLQEQVIVDEGKVSFCHINQSPNQVIYLTENEVGTWFANNNSISENIVSERNINSSLSGRLIFNENTLSEVISDFNRIYEIQIELADQSFGAKKYTGTFNNIEPEKALETIAITLNLTIEKSKNSIILKK